MMFQLSGFYFRSGWRGSGRNCIRTGRRLGGNLWVLCISLDVQHMHFPYSHEYNWSMMYLQIQSFGVQAVED